jgi:hypothetical protein
VAKLHGISYLRGWLIDLPSLLKLFSIVTPFIILFKGEKYLQCPHLRTNRPRVPRLIYIASEPGANSGFSAGLRYGHWFEECKVYLRSKLVDWWILCSAVMSLSLCTCSDRIFCFLGPLLKGQCHEIFVPRFFFHQTIPPRALIHGLKPFRIWLRISRENWWDNCWKCMASAVSYRPPNPLWHRGSLRESENWLSVPLKGYYSKNKYICKHYILRL